MMLSEDEQKSLHGIEISLLADDPRLATTLDAEAVKLSLGRRRRFAHYALWIGFAFMLVGAHVAEGWFSIGAMVSCYGVVMQGWSTVAIVRCDRALAASGPDDRVQRR